MFNHGRHGWLPPLTLRVLEAFLDNPGEQLAGADVQRRTGLGSGTLYPILLRLERVGWLVSRWESFHAHRIGGGAGPRRRLYRVTPAGMARASAAFGPFSVPFRRGVLYPGVLR